MKWTADEVVLIKIVGDKRPDDGTLPKVRDGHGVIGRLLDWMAAEGVAEFQGLSVSPGFFSGLFEPAEATRVKAWLAAQPEFGKPG